VQKKGEKWEEKGSRGVTNKESQRKKSGIAKRGTEQRKRARNLDRFCAIAHVQEKGLCGKVKEFESRRGVRETLVDLRTKKKKQKGEIVGQEKSIEL